MVKYVESEIAEVKRNPFDIKEQMVYTNVGSGKKVVLNKCLDKDIEVAIIPEGVEQICIGAFKGCTKLRRVSLPRSVSWIESSAFQGCVSLEEVECMSPSLQLDSSCFSKCSSLETVPFRGDTLKYGIPWRAFQYCDGLVNIIIPDGVTRIDEGAFEDCKSLRSVIIPDSVKRIRCKAFAGCSSLEHVTLPDSIMDIEEDVFKGCDNVIINYKGVQLSGSDFAKGVTEDLELLIQDKKDYAKGIKSDRKIADDYDYGF